MQLTPLPAVTYGPVGGYAICWTAHIVLVGAAR